MSVKCKWGDSKTENFSVTSGTKQGGVLSPNFFASYIDEIFGRLLASGIGCYVASVFLACILFADDMALLAPTRSSLQRMIDICVTFCDENCLRFNVKKTKAMVFGKKYSEGGSFAPLKIGGNDIEYVDNWRYLGFNLKSGRQCSFCPEAELASFYRASNCIIRSLKRPNEAVLLHLIYTNCVSILSYGSDVKEFSNKDFLRCNTALNNVIRKIFSFQRWESIRALREQFGYCSLTELFEKSRRRFWNSISNSSNPIVSHLYHVLSVTVSS